MMHRKVEHRINVLGASGSGASSVGRQIAASLAVPYFDSDDYYHAPSDPPFQSPRDPVERFNLATRDMRPDESWVLGGGVAGWAPYPEVGFTRIVFLWVPTELRIERLRRRERARFGARIAPGGDMHQQHLDFLEWSAHYDAGDREGKSLPKHRAWLETQRCPVVEVDGALPLEEIVRRALPEST